MSTRHIRKLMAAKEQQELDKKKEEEVEPEEFQPHFAHMNPVYNLLEVQATLGSNSVSESVAEVTESQHCEEQEQDDGPTVILEEDKYGAKKKSPINTNPNDKNKNKETNNTSKNLQLEVQAPVGSNSVSESVAKVTESQRCEEQDQDGGPTVIPEEDKYGAKKKTFTNTNYSDKKKNKNKNKTSRKLKLEVQAPVGSNSVSEYVAKVTESQRCEEQDQDGDPTVIPEEDKYGAKKKTFTNTNYSDKKKNKNKNKTSRKLKMDEVEWSVKEVNRILGAPPEVKEEAAEPDKKDKGLFCILPNKLNPNYELDKVFGKDPGATKKSRKSCSQVKQKIGLSPDFQPVRMNGLSMAQYRKVDGIKYFKFLQSRDYQMRCREVIGVLKQLMFVSVEPCNVLFSETCVEALLENCNYYYYLEEHESGNRQLEQAIYILQLVSDRTFNLLDGKSVLLYVYVENRPFHIALLKYLYVLTNTACHRTALELAKVLLTLDPSDPLGVIFILDTVAIRSREYQWLLDLIEHWKDDRQVLRLFHMKYSYSLALFHLAYKKKDQNGIEESKLQLKNAIKFFPRVALKILELLKRPETNKVKNHVIFTSESSQSGDVYDLMNLYAWMIAPRWREPEVMAWFLDTINSFVESYDQTESLRTEMKRIKLMRSLEYLTFPIEMKRHLQIIAPMAKYIADEGVPYTEPTVAFNPYPSPENCVDTYNHFAGWGEPDSSNTSYPWPFFEANNREFR